METTIVIHGYIGTGSKTNEQWVNENWTLLEIHIYFTDLNA